jgi:curved DNA-binding protein CbpA
MDNFKDYYRRLGIGPDADGATIKTAFRRLARRYHPDVTKDKKAARRFLAIREAYDVLSDPHKRQEYDRVRSARRPAPPAPVPSRERPRPGPGRARRFGVALDALGLRLGITVDADIAGRPTKRRNAPPAAPRGGPGPRTA